MFTLLIKLGLWQKARGEAKQVTELILEETQHAAPVSLTPNTLTRLIEGELATGTKLDVQFKESRLPLIYLDNQTLDGKVGYLVYQVMGIANTSQMVLIELGFVRGAQSRDVLPNSHFKLEDTALVGRAYTKLTNPLANKLMAETDLVINNASDIDTANNEQAIRVQALNWDELEVFMDVELARSAIQPIANNWPLPQPWMPVPLSSAKHYGYAFQWFAMATVWLLLTGFISVKWLIRRKGGTHVSSDE
ncbi:SURF1 family protein [Vibrio maerlii]|uniref:SURF1 family protein n=1 Tax=Vibrio maerlii TaxID=2231648 RepID=UPI0013DFECEE|nr:SURF1 family protein [Vibrio maerlii]